MKGQLLPKVFMFFVLLFFSIIFFSILFVMLSTLNVKMNIEIVYKPIFLPSISEYIYYSIFSTENLENLEKSLSSIIGNYKIEIDGKIFGNKEMKCENVYENVIIREKIMRIRICV